MRAVLISGLFLVGCASGAPSSWSKEGAGERDLIADRYACSQESRVGLVTGSDEARVFIYGNNRLAQAEANRLFTMCMQAHGWRSPPQ